MGRALTPPVLGGRQVAGDVGVRCVLRGVVALAGEAHGAHAAVVGGEGEVDTTRGAVERVGPHAALPRAHDLAGPRAETVDLEGGASHCFAVAGERAGAAQPTEKLDRAAGGLHVRYSAERRG